MRALITAQQLRRDVPGGIGTYVRGLFSGLSTTGTDTTAWISRGAPPSLPGGVAVRSSMLPGPVLTRAWDAGLGIRSSLRVDRVHATSLSVPGHPRGGPPLSCFVHDLAWRRFPEAFPPRGRRWHERSLARAIHRCDLLLVPSTSTADDLLAAGAPHHRVHVVPEGSDHLPIARRDPDGGRYLLSVSTLEPRKNLRRLVEAYRIARPQLAEPWPLKIVGPTGWGEHLGDLAAVEGVELVGRVDDASLAALLAGARAVAYVPLFEGFGLPVLEAMRADVPVLASTSVPAARPGTVVSSDPTDMRAMVRALITVLEDDEVRSAIVTEGHRHAAEHIWQRTAAHHLELWEAQR